MYDTGITKMMASGWLSESNRIADMDDGDDYQQKPVLAVVILAPVPVGAVTLHGIAHRQTLLHKLYILIQQFSSLFRRADVLILQAEPVLFYYRRDGITVF